jgi:hypothetical protein
VPERSLWKKKLILRHERNNTNAFCSRTYLKRFPTEKMKAGTKEYYISALDISKFNGEEFDIIKRAIKQRNIRRICVEDNLYLYFDNHVFGVVNYNSGDVLMNTDFAYNLKQIVATTDGKHILCTDRNSMVFFDTKIFFQNV